MNKNALAALTAVNSVALLALGAALAVRGDAPDEPAPRPAASAAGDAPDRLADLERRLARLEAAAVVRRAAPLAGGADVSRAAQAAPSDEGARGGASVASDDAPVTRSEVQALIAEQLARRDAASPAAGAQGAPPARPRRTVREVAGELGLDAHQETSVRTLYRQLERDSMKVLFEVDDAGLEQLKADLARAEHDPRLKEQLRERLAVNWTRRSSEVGVLWVKLDARLRELLGPELLPRFYGFDVQLDEREFPDLMQMFFAPPGSEGEGR